MSIVDCFMFNDEVEILSFRLRYYRDIVSKFIISESNIGFDGRPKDALARKVLLDLNVPQSQFVIVNYYPTEELLSDIEHDRWPLERFARQALYSEISKLDPSSVVLLSDVDEIASVPQILNNLKCTSITSLVTPLYYRRANWLSPQGKNWSTFKLGPASEFQDLNENRYRVTMVDTKNPGAHFSYLATSPSDVVKKSKTSAHKEFELTESDAFVLLSSCDEFAIDHLGRFNREGFGLLKVIKAEKLSSVQRQFQAMYPEFFSFVRPKHGVFARLLASYKVTNWWESRSLDSNSKLDFLLFFLQLAKQILLNSIKRIRNFLIFMKRVIKRPSFPKKLR